jgi:1-acyl-sn-glycerol-3-phosphate acyltransferase
MFQAGVWKMPGFFDNSNNDGDDLNHVVLIGMFYLICFSTASYFLVASAERKNKLNYEDRIARVMAGFIQLFMRVWHTSGNRLEIPGDEPVIIAAGPHKTALEAAVLASKLEGNPPQFLATDSFNVIPGVASLLKMFKTITVESNRKANVSAKSQTLDKATSVLNNKGCVALFPQGNFTYIGNKPPIIYSGAAQLAIKTETKIYVVRLDGYWSITNPIIPVSVRNNRYYRAFFSAFHPNNIQTNLCSIIDFHLQDHNKKLPDEEKIREINAQLYAYFRHSSELSESDLNEIKNEIKLGKHLEIWDKAYREYQALKHINSKADSKELVTNAM